MKKINEEQSFRLSEISLGLDDLILPRRPAGDPAGD